MRGFGGPKKGPKEQMLLDQMEKLQKTINDMNQKQESAEPFQQEMLTVEIQRMRSAMIELKKKASFQNRTIYELQQETVLQNKKIEEAQRRLELELKNGSNAMPSLHEHGDIPEECIDEIQKGSIEVKAANGHNWRASGYSSVIPHPDFNYFPGLVFGPKLSRDGLTYDYADGKVISAIVPCYNEGSLEINRTIRSLFRQRLPRGWRVEVVIVMDGADHMSDSMIERIRELFGIDLKSNDENLNPLLAMPSAETIIIEPADSKTARRRIPAIEGTVGGYTLVVKRHNHRKANSQMWWLGPHGSFLNCKYALATDCGTVFARTATVHLIRRLDAEQNLHAVTGFQRIMTSEMQGDGSYELINRPFEFLLRMVQRFEFEVDHVSFKSIYDSIGCMHVIPGPCGLFRYSAMGTLKEGLMSQYFRLFHHSSQGLIVGNVELVEDRIPGTLLSFPLKEDKEEVRMPPEGWPRTGFVHEALFYIEAEKPLSQLIKQRRRWLNGTFATYIWMLNEGIIMRSNQDYVNKLLSQFLVIINVIQGLVVRFMGPSLLVVWMFRFGLFIPDIIADPATIFDPTVSLTYLEFKEHRLKYGLMTGGGYLLLYIVFILAHIPHAKPVKKGIQITRYTEPTAYSCDKRSAYRNWLFGPVLFVNFMVIVLFCLNLVGIMVTQGWAGTPVIVKILISICFIPFILGLLEGLMYRDFRCLGGMIMSAPFALILQVWFSIWLPAYATTRLSDLTWGNRERISSLDESEKALARARNGRKVGWLLILSTIGISTAVILLMQLHGLVFPFYVLGYTMILSSTYLFSFCDLLFRCLACNGCDSEDPLIEEDYMDGDDCSTSTEAYVSGNATDPNVYKVMEGWEKKTHKGAFDYSSSGGSDNNSATDGSEDSSDSYQKMPDEIETQTTTPQVNNNNITTTDHPIDQKEEPEEAEKDPERTDHNNKKRGGGGGRGFQSFRNKLPSIKLIGTNRKDSSCGGGESSSMTTPLN